LRTICIRAGAETARIKRLGFRLQTRFAKTLIAYIVGAFLLSIVFVAGCGESGNVAEIERESEPSVAAILPPTVTPTPPNNEFPIVGQPERFLLDDLSLVGIDEWINTEPLTLSQIGDLDRVILLDFWTYTCVNCVRTFPYLKAWHDTYAEHGLVIIGVHSPEFDFEKSVRNVQAAVDRYGIEYPVALDSDKQTWDKYGNHFWPSKYLLSTSGDVVLRHFGEGGYEEFESTIRAELERAGRDLTEVPMADVAGPERSTSAHTITRELYGGYTNGYLSDGLYAGQGAYYESPDIVVDYADDGTRRHGQYFLDGRWLNKSTAIVSGESAQTNPAQFAFEFFATSVNAVLGVEPNTTEVIVELDGHPLKADEAGVDITWDEKQRSVVHIHETRLYQIIELPEFGNHELTLKTNSEGLTIYTVTFGVNEYGP
jgi:thiol-disulfide isomerase/thioredoxin